jgi:hypothetical protein
MKPEDNPETIEFIDPAPVTWACLFVVGSFDPDELTELLGVGAKTRRAGDKIGRLTASEESWHFSTPKQSSVDWPAAIEQVLAVVRPHEKELRAYKQKHGLRIRLDLCAEMYDNARTPLGGVSPETIAELARLDAGIDIDLYTGCSHD